MSMADGAGQGIGRIGTRNRRQIKQAFDHFLHLFLGGLAVAHHRLLDLPAAPRPDAADALACAICHAHGSSLGALSTAGFRVRGGRLV